MTPDQERRGAEMFSQGQSERQVADELGVSASSAHRLKLRLEQPEAAPAPEIETGPEQPDEAVLQAADGILTDEAMALLEGERDRLAGELENLQARAQASLSAGHRLTEERDQLLLTTGDASPVRQRLIDAENDYRDWTRAIELTTAHLSEVSGRIEALTGYRELAERRAQLDAAVAERDQVLSQSGSRQRAAVAAVRAAAEEFCAVAADELAATERAAVLSSAVTAMAMQLGEQVPVVPPPASTRLVGLRQEGRGELALRRALGFAERGDVDAVARALGEASGWTPPGPPDEEELKRWRQMTEDRERQLAEAKAQNARGPGGTEARVIDLDQNGREIWPRPPHPLDSYQPGYTTGRGYGSGYSTGW